MIDIKKRSANERLTVIGAKTVDSVEKIKEVDHNETNVLNPAQHTPPREHDEENFFKRNPLKSRYGLDKLQLAYDDNLKTVLESYYERVRRPA